MVTATKSIWTKRDGKQSSSMLRGPCSCARTRRRGLDLNLNEPMEPYPGDLYYHLRFKFIVDDTLYSTSHQ